MIKRIGIIVLIFLLMTGCLIVTKTGPSVSMKQAQKVATDYYRMVKVSQSEIKLINEDFIQPNENPVYFVIEGENADGNRLIVFVESNNANKHYVKYIDR